MRHRSLKKNILLSTLIFFNIIFFQKTANAFIPNAYIPNQKILTNTSIGIGLTSNEYIKYGQAERAIGLAKLALSLNPKEVELWIILANAELNNNLLDQALISIKKAKELNSTRAVIWFTEATIEMQKGRIDSAIKSINKSLEINNKNSHAYFLLGNAKLMQEKHIVSLQAFKKAVEINPKLWQALNNQGLIYYELGKKKLAIKTWRKVLKIKADPETKLALAIALYSIEPNSKESIKLAKEALEENPNYFYQKHQTEQLWGEKLIAAGIELFRNPKLKSVINTASANANFTN